MSALVRPRTGEMTRRPRITQIKLVYRFAEEIDKHQEARNIKCAYGN